MKTGTKLLMIFGFFIVVTLVVFQITSMNRKKELINRRNERCEKFSEALNDNLEKRENSTFVSCYCYYEHKMPKKLESIRDEISQSCSCDCKTEDGTTHKIFLSVVGNQTLPGNVSGQQIENKSAVVGK